MCNLTQGRYFDGRPICWNEDPQCSPARSGVYLTRNGKGQTWFKYFVVSLGRWTMSWAERQANAPRATAWVRETEVAEQVVAWAANARSL